MGRSGILALAVTSASFIAAWSGWLLWDGKSTPEVRTRDYLSAQPQPRGTPAISVDLLKRLPQVATACVAAPVAAPVLTILHVKNWHLLPKTLFSADLRDLGELLSDEAIDEAYEAHLQDVESVQQEQVELLRYLIREHGIDAVYLEGLSESDCPLFEMRIGSLRQIEEALPSLRNDLVKTKSEIRGLESRGARVHQELVALRTELETILAEHRMEMLRIGAPGQLYLSGELAQILPLEDAGAFRATHPLKTEGRIVLDPGLQEAREDAQIAILCQKESGACVVLLGGAHDLADNTRRRGRQDVELIVLETQGYRTASGR